ncbi:MAG: hypothetical protein GY873_30060 [Bosea sp.]|uniref:hypothetical protein n=1 Tax=Bosea sp. (in: a-proteobacteria) TaxID=1871050 RepID=UPI0023A1B251|nr:hypothetical protein [Bosea sp. (in: a-proteobacteria)]
MHPLKRLFAVCALVLLCGAARTQTIEFATVDPAAVGFATFNANTQKIARNRHGALLAYVKGQNASYTGQDVRFVLVSPEGSSAEVLAETWATNAPCIEASDSGEFFAAFPDWSLNQLKLFIWRDVAANRTPERHVLSLQGDGKFSCVFDENRRTLYYLGHSGVLVKARVDGVSFETQQLWTNGANPAQYPALHISRDGVLHVFWSSVTGSNVHYRSAQYLATPNDGGNWFQTWHPRFTGASVSVPVAADETGLSTTMSRSEDIAANTPLEATLADDDSFQAIWLFTPGFAERCFTVEKRCSSVHIKHSRLTGQRVAQHVPIRAGAGSVLRPKGGGGLIRRGPDVYFITTDQNDVVLLKIADAGATEVGRFAVPGGGPGRCPYSLGVAKGHESDADIVGSFTLLDVSCAIWATYTGSPPLTGSVIRFRVAL